MPDTLKFRDILLDEPKPKGIDVHCKLKDFAIITYAVEISRLSGLIPERFKLYTLKIKGTEKALLSVVPFKDVDFTLAVYPFPKFSMGQTNYRIYIIDSVTGENGVWFLGTTLDSWSVMIPKYLWKLPWHPGKINFDCVYDSKKGYYDRYLMKTVSDWAPAHCDLTQNETEIAELAGFPDQETGLVCLTHPLKAFYKRRDGKLGSYQVWHKKLNVQPGLLTKAHFGLLSRLGLVTETEQQEPHSVLLDPLNAFTIYLPPQVVKP